jgi:hypothetical protein
LEPLDAFSQYSQDVSGSALVELSRTHRQSMFKKLLSEIDLNTGRSSLADDVAKKLQEAAKKNAGDNGADRNYEGGKRLS